MFCWDLLTDEAEGPPQAKKIPHWSFSRFEGSQRFFRPPPPLPRFFSSSPLLPFFFLLLLSSSSFSPYPCLLILLSSSSSSSSPLLLLSSSSSSSPPPPLLTSSPSSASAPSTTGAACKGEITRRGSAARSWPTATLRALGRSLRAAGRKAAPRNARKKSRTLVGFFHPCSPPGDTSLAVSASASMVEPPGGRGGHGGRGGRGGKGATGKGKGRGGRSGCSRQEGARCLGYL